RRRRNVSRTRTLSKFNLRVDVWICRHPERSEGSAFQRSTRSFASLRMTDLCTRKLKIDRALAAEFLKPDTHAITRRRKSATPYVTTLRPAVRSRHRRSLGQDPSCASSTGITDTFAGWAARDNQVLCQSESAHHHAQASLPATDRCCG